MAFFFSSPARAQAFESCSAADQCFAFAYKGLVRNSNNTVTLTFTVQTNCGYALSHVAFELPAGVKASNAVNSNKKFSYSLENTTNNPFYSVKFEAINAEGFKNGATDQFSYTIPAAAFDKMTTIRVSAKASTTVGTVSFKATGCAPTICNKPAVTLTGPETICNLSDNLYQFSAGKAEAGTNYVFTLPEGLIIVDGEGTSTILVQAILEEAQLNQPLAVAVTATNACGSTQMKTSVVVQDCEPAKTLPVELISFEGSSTSTAVTLTWATASEKNNDRFEVERSRNGVDFEKVGEVKGHGTSQVMQPYTFSAAAATAGLTYYRLKQVDFDGTSEYSKVIAVEVKTGSTAVTLTTEAAYPNPFQHQLHVQFTTTEKATAHITLYNLSGRAVFTQQVAAQTGLNQTIISGLDTLASGVYILKVTAGNQSTTQRILKAN